MPPGGEPERQQAVDGPVVPRHIRDAWHAGRGGHDVRIACREDHHLAGLQTHRGVETVDGLGPAGALGDDVEADDAVRGAYHLLADLVRAGALGRERGAGVDVEEDRTGQADGQQDVGQRVHRAPPRTPATFFGRPNGVRRGADVRARHAAGRAFCPGVRAP